MIKFLSLEQFYRLPDDLISNYDNIVLQYVEMLEHKRTQLRRNIGSLYFGTACWQLKHQIVEIISISDLLSVRFVDTKLICRRSLNHKHADSKHGNMKISLFWHFTTVRCQGNWNIFIEVEGQFIFGKSKPLVLISRRGMLLTMLSLNISALAPKWFAEFWHHKLHKIEWVSVTTNTSSFNNILC